MASRSPPSTADYWVGPIIGQRAFSQVHYAKHKESQRKVAIKVVDQATIRRYPKLLTAILQEQKLLSSSLRGVCCVVQLGSSFYDSNCLYMVMELCEGGDLDLCIQHYWHTLRATSSEERDGWLRSIPSYLSQIRKAIDIIHACHIVHCDIKPANILLSSDMSNVRLADFGSAWDLSNPSLKLEDGLRGTTEYSPPELIRNQTTDMPKAIDFWSYGCLALAMYNGRSPFYQQGSGSLTVQAIFEYESSDDRDSLLENVCKMWKGTNCYDNGAVAVYSGLLHPDPSKRNETWEGGTGQPEPPIEVMLATSSTDRASTDRPSSLLQPEWTTDVETCELQDGAIGWSVFI